MNIKLECYVSVPLKKRGYLVETDGRVVKRSLTKTVEGLNMKQQILNNIFEGLQSVKSIVKHESLFTIVVQNRHVAQWLLNREEQKYKDYVDYMDKIFDVFEELDCRYQVVFLPRYEALDFVKKSNDFDKVELESVESIFEDME